MVVDCVFREQDGCGHCIRCGYVLCGVAFPIRRQCTAASVPPVPLFKKAINFAASAAKHFAAGAPRCTDEQIASRHDICLGCEHYQGGACTQCGCPVSREKNLISKLAWADQSCPVGKWGPVG